MIAPKPKARAFIDTPLAAGAQVSAPDAVAHHLGAVLRLKAGDTVTLFNGHDGEWAATVAEATKKRLTLQIEAQTRPQTPEPDIWLLFAPLKKNATDYLVEKATELGCTRLIPVLSQRTETRRLNTDRLSATARDAAQQCERLSVPVIDAPHTLQKVLADWPEDRTILAALERAEAPLLTDAAKTTVGPHAILIGPEGGWTEAELDLLKKQATLTGVTLGPRILRAETAAVVALGLWQAACGDFARTN